MAPIGYDFGGWATKNDMRCQDGLVIKKDAFKSSNGKKVPLFWNHNHDDPSCVLGHAILENRNDGVYAYGFFNKTKAGKDAKEQLVHGDIDSLSIWANNLMKSSDDVLDGVIREVSLVPAGQNPGAFIESVIAHGMSMDEYDDEGIIYTGEGLEIAHGIDSIRNKEEDTEVAKTYGDVLDTLNDEQKEAVGAMLSQYIDGDSDEEDDDYDDDEEYDDDYDEDDYDDYAEDDLEDNEMKHSVFNRDQVDDNNVISHSMMGEILEEASRGSGRSLRDVFEEYTNGGELMHSIDTTGMSTSTGTQTYGFNDPNMLFPDYKSLNTPPEWLKRNTDWVSIVMNGVHHTPFSRIKSLYADITEDAARAKGYIKGNMKKEEVFSLLKRTTDPQTIYKKQKMDKDDITDITDFDVVAWIKTEMRMMLNEEIARAILIGDGRMSSDDDKIQESHVRPIVNDVPLFNIKYPIQVQTNGSDDTDDIIAKRVINGAIRARTDYKGSGNPIFFTTEKELTEMLLLEDGIGHKLYKSEAELATAMRVSRIVTVEVMEGEKITINSVQYPLIGVIVNLSDYNVGADKGGSISMFDQFDIDYNQYKYLIETRISGALTRPYSAITLYRDKAI